jgi:hypothetical protein
MSRALIVLGLVLLALGLLGPIFGKLELAGCLGTH